jgi:hypothetical protein
VRLRNAAVVLLALWIAAPSDAAIPFALKFGAAATNRVEIAANATINTLPAFTVLLRTRVDTIVSGGNFWGKTPNTLTRNHRLQMSGVLGDVQVNIRRTGGAADYKTSDLPIVAGVPTGLAFTIDTNLTSNCVHIYSWTQTRPFAESTYSSSVCSTGLTETNTSNPMTWGNALDSGPVYSSALQGVIWEGYVWSRVLDATVLGGLSKMKAPIPIDPSMVVAMTLGANGSGRVIDRSGRGNHGTITGAIPSNDVLPRVDFRRP